MLNTNPVSNKIKYTLPDDCDRASSIVGYDINNYVFGNDTFSPVNQNNQNVPSVQNNSQNKKTNGILGGALLLGLTMLAVNGLKKGGVKLPCFNQLKTNITNFISNFKPKTP